MEEIRDSGRVHRPVMLREVLDALSPAPGERFLDLTVGAGGHSREIASRLGPSGVLIGMDLDEEILEIAKRNLTEPGMAPCRLVHGDYLDCRDAMKDAGLDAVDGILLDLGVSSLQLDDPSRGFSFAADGPLDMRMDPSGGGTTAAEVVNFAPQHELERIFREYGEERFARRIARRIVDERGVERLTGTARLAEIVTRAVGRYRQRNIHPATRVFQALRIEVNAELENLRSVLDLAPDLLDDGGRIAVIAFHSLEDRIVKEDFRHRASRGLYELLTKKPLRPSPEEVDANPRSRSARLRAAKRSAP